MNEDNKKLISAYLTLTVGSAAILFLSTATGFTDIQFDSSFVVPFVGVTTALYLVMFVTYHISSKYTK
ncbi:hypothetical protein SAMN04488691_102383 [Haloferax larsenii]|uniref:Uncharacterized protein n=1 Tax=Haloferax larsenii TaxID=302484 RepID=A0A1H7LR46_HALLR|nr:hypothetical protein SAMN04488691_102383 [Haloferax larsenii]